VELYFPDSTYFGAVVARLARVPYVVRTRRNLGHDIRAIDRWMGRIVGRLVDATVVNCGACGQAVVEQEAARPESVVVLENGIDLEPFAQVPPYTPSTNGRPRRVGMVANLRPVKGVEVFVRAAAIVAKMHPDVVFELAGTGDCEPTRQLARECGIDDRLKLLGSVDDIPGFLRELDVAVLTSHAEGLSNAILEYMAAGRPIVATAVGGNEEVIEDGVTGLLVPRGQPDAVAGAIDRFLRDPVMAVRFGAAASNRAHEKYCQEAATRRYERFYDELTRNKGSRKGPSAVCVNPAGGETRTTQSPPRLGRNA